MKFPRTSRDETYKKWMLVDMNTALNKDKEIMSTNLEKYPQLKAFYNDPKQKGFDGDIKKTDRIGRLFCARNLFEKYLMRYIKSRNQFEAIVNKTSALVNSFIGSEADEVTVKIKMIIQENINEAQMKVQEVGKNFNFIGMASLESQPEFPGNYSWFSYQRGEQLIERKPFHMHLVLKEAEDVYIKVEEMRAAAILSEKFGVVVKKEEIDKNHATKTC